MDANNTGNSFIGFLNVSIHAPVMDANYLDHMRQGQAGVSIHAPVMDANARWCRCVHLHDCFNPRARDGRELIIFFDNRGLAFQSTRP